MTDRQRFENRAIECGATVIESLDTRLTVVATDGVMTTTYIFNEDGSFKRIER